MTEPQLVCPCGTPHGHTPSLLITNPTAWQTKVRPNILSRDGEVCQLCGDPAPIRGYRGVRSGHCGHVLARELGGCDSPRNLRAECARCSVTDGQRIGQAKRRESKIKSAISVGIETKGSVSSDDHGSHDPGSLLPSLSKINNGAAEVDVATFRTPDAGDGSWDALTWINHLRDVPEDSTWPRLMTAPHPAAVGSYGQELIDQFRARNGRDLRWWQQLAAMRLLEHDAEGVLVWRTYLLTVARQLGKSWLLRELLLWRVNQGARWGEQLALHTGRNLTIVREVLKPAQAWAAANGLWVSRNNMEPGISTGDHMTGSRWVIVSKDGTYGFSPGNGVVDEAWDVAPRYVDEGLEPTIVEQTSPQMGLISTAHRRSTSLMLARRRQAVEQVLAPRSLLLLEWSAPADLALDDERGWRLASPHWTPQRQELVAAACDKAMRGEEDADAEDPDPVAGFEAQWLNRWPTRKRALVELPGERLLAEGAWEALADDGAEPTGRLHIAVEDNLGRGASAACAGLTVDGRVVVGGWEFDSLRDAFQWANGWYEAVPGSQLVVGASLENDLEVQELAVPVDTAGRAETPGTLALWRTLVAADSVTHDGGDDLARHVEAARVRANTDASALQLVSADRSDLLRAASWVIARADRDRGARVAVH